MNGARRTAARRRADEVRRDAATGEEGPEVDRRAVDGRVATARPLDLGDLQAAALGGLGDRLDLEDARIERRGPVRERLAVDVEGVVGRAVTPGHAPVASVYQPAPVFGGAWVSSPSPGPRRPSSGSCPWSAAAPLAAYLATRSWRRPSAAKNSAASAFAARGRGCRRRRWGGDDREQQRDASRASMQRAGRDHRAHGSPPWGHTGRRWSRSAPSAGDGERPPPRR